MRKGRDGETELNWTENDGENSGHYVVASRPPNGDWLQRRRSCQKFVVGGVTAMANLNPSCIELELGLGFDNWWAINYWAMNNFTIIYEPTT